MANSDQNHQLSRLGMTVNNLLRRYIHLEHANRNSRGFVGMAFEKDLIGRYAHSEGWRPASCRAPSPKHLQPWELDAAELKFAGIECYISGPFSFDALGFNDRC